MDLKKHFRRLPWPSITLWLVAILFLLGFYDWVERYWLDWAPLRLIQMVHLLRGISLALLIILPVAFYLIKRSPATSIVGGAFSSTLSEEESIRRRALWLIHMRWIAVALTFSAVVIACRLTSLLPPEDFLPLLFCLLALILANSFFALRVFRTKKSYRFLVAQVVVDLLLLTLLLYFSGGVKNPFYLIYLFHVMIGGIILSRRDALLVTILAGLLFVGLLLAGSPEDNSPFVPGVPFLLVLGFTSYFTILLRSQIRSDENGVVQASKFVAIGELAGRIAHEINNPIGIIMARIKLLLEDPHLPEGTAATLKKIDKQSQRIAELTRGLLTFSRPSLGKKFPLDLGRIVGETLDFLEPEVTSRGIKIERKLAAVPPVEGNPNELQQILLNLINNALDAMPGGGRLTVEQRKGEKGGVELTLADTGHGISPAVMSRIFDPFFTTKEGGKGTGLGLSITHGLVRSHGGTIEVKSGEGRGTVVTIRFPLKEEGVHAV